MRKNVFSFDMSSLYKTRDRDVERILSGKAPADGGHDDLCLLVRELQNAFPAGPVPAEAEAAHLAAIESALLQSQEGGSVVGSGSDVSGSGTRTSGLLPTKRRKPVFGRLFASPAVKIAAVAIGVFAVFGGVAAAGSIPRSGAVGGLSRGCVRRTRHPRGLRGAGCADGPGRRDPSR
jgi:hypothetical protein